MARGKYRAKGRGDDDDDLTSEIGEDDADWDADEDEASPRSTKSLLQELKARFTGPPPPKPVAKPSAGKGQSTREIVNGLDNRERNFGLALVVFAVGIVIWLGYAYAHQPKTAKPKVDWLIVVAIAGVPTLIMAVGLAIKRRALLGFASLLTGYALLAAGGGLFGLLFFGFGIWLVVRAFRYNKQARTAAAESGGPTATRSTRTRSGAGSGGASGSSSTSTKPAGTGSSGRSDAGGSGKASSGRRSSSKPEPVKAPAKSKRYTPPRPPTPQRRKTPSS